MNPPETESPTEILPPAHAPGRPMPQIVAADWTAPRPVTPEPRGGASPAGASGHLLCEQCRAPVDREQRYCVSCGARQTHAPDPAVGYFAAAAAARRSARARPRSSRDGRAPLYGLFFMLLPLAVAVGVLVGRGGSNDNAALLALLRNQKPIVVNTTAAGPAPAAATATAAATSASTPPSSATLGTGFVVELQTLPTAGTTEATVTAADSAATAKGATALGLISPTTTRTSPDQGPADYVIYSGFYTSRSAATAALGRLKSRFPTAKVIAVAPVANAASNPAAAAPSQGSAGQLLHSRPTAAQIMQDSHALTQLSKATGQSYIQAQNHLPRMTSIPPSGAPATAGSTPSAPPSSQP